MHPVAYFTWQNPFSRFSGATGARACKSNARCPLVNLRINTHRGDNLRSQRIHAVLTFYPTLSLPPVLYFFSLVTREQSIFGTAFDCTSVPEGEEPVRSPHYIRSPRSLRLRDVDTSIICRSAENISNILRQNDVCASGTFLSAGLFVWSVMRGMFTDTLG